MRIMTSGFTLHPNANTRDGVNFAGGKKVATGDKSDLAMARLMPVVRNLFDAFDKGHPVTNQQGQPMDRTDFGDVFEIRGHGANQRWAIKTDQSIKEGKNAKKLQQVTARLQNMLIHRRVMINPDTPDKVDMLNKFAKAHLDYLAESTPENHQALLQASGKVRETFKAPIGTQIPIDDEGTIATLI